MVHFQCLYREHNQDFKAQNRYNDVLPYKHNLVEVKDESGGNIYVNGSYINVPIRCCKAANSSDSNPLNYGERAFIAASAPVEKSLNNFWEMIFQNKVRLIVMLCNIKEKNVV
jgi:protein tyrosine phosphatase